jgi:hypothetical protein
MDIKTFIFMARNRYTSIENVARSSDWSADAHVRVKFTSLFHARGMDRLPTAGADVDADVGVRAPFANDHAKKVSGGDACPTPFSIPHLHFNRDSTSVVNTS